MKYSVDFNDQVHGLLSEMAKKEGRSKCEILRRALGLYSYFHKEMHEDQANKVMAVLDRKGKVLKQLKWT